MATARTGPALFVEPTLRLGFLDDREDLDRCFRNVIEHPDVADSQSELGQAQPPQPFDAALADLRRLVSQVPLDGVLDLGPKVRGQAPQRPHGRGRKDDLERHSGQIIAGTPAALPGIGPGAVVGQRRLRAVTEPLTLDRGRMIGRWPRVDGLAPVPGGWTGGEAVSVTVSVLRVTRPPAGTCEA